MDSGGEPRYDALVAGIRRRQRTPLFSRRRHPRAEGSRQRARGNRRGPKQASTRVTHAWCFARPAPISLFLALPLAWVPACHCFATIAAQRRDDGATSECKSSINMHVRDAYCAARLPPPHPARGKQPRKRASIFAAPASPQGESLRRNPASFHALDLKIPGAGVFRIEARCAGSAARRERLCHDTAVSATPALSKRERVHGAMEYFSQKNLQRLRTKPANRGFVAVNSLFRY